MYQHEKWQTVTVDFCFKSTNTTGKYHVQDEQVNIRVRQIVNNYYVTETTNLVLWNCKIKTYK